MNPPSTFVVEYELSEEELASFLSESVARSRLYRWLWPQRRFGLGLSFIALLIAVSVAFGREEWWADWHIRLYAAALFGGLVFLHRRSIRS